MLPEEPEKTFRWDDHAPWLVLFLRARAVTPPPDSQLYPLVPETLRTYSTLFSLSTHSIK